MADENVLVRLTKLMGMSTSSNDNEALAAVRMANRELTTLGKSWDDLLKGKITIIGDPFGNIEAPPTGRGTPPPPMARPQKTNVPPPPRAPRTTPKAQYNPPWHIPSAAPSPPPPPNRINFYGGNCVACFNYVGAKSGFIKRGQFQGWDVYCTPCFQSNASPKPKTPTQPMDSLA